MLRQDTGGIVDRVRAEQRLGSSYLLSHQLHRELINDYLANTKDTENMSDQTIHLLASANRWRRPRASKRSLWPALRWCAIDTHTVVCRSPQQRYSGMDLEWCKTCDRGLPSPDCVIYLDMPVEEAAKRQFGEERYEKIDFRSRFVRSSWRSRPDEANGSCLGTVDASRTLTKSGNYPENRH